MIARRGHYPLGRHTNRSEMFDQQFEDQLVAAGRALVLCIAREDHRIHRTSFLLEIFRQTREQLVQCVFTPTRRDGRDNDLLVVPVEGNAGLGDVGVGEMKKSRAV